MADLDPQDRKRAIQEAIRDALAVREQEIRERLGEGVRQVLDDALQGLSDPLPLPDDLLEPPRAAAASSTEDVLTDLHASVDRLATSDDQVSILNNLADGAARFLTRSALFVIRGGKAIGWTTVGFPPDPAEFRRVSLALDGDHVVARAVSARARQEGNDSAAAQQVWDVIGAEGSEAYTAVPLIVRDRVVAVLFGDAGDGSLDPMPIRGGALATLARVAEVCLANLSKGKARGVSMLVERRPSQSWEAGPSTGAGETPASRAPTVVPPPPAPAVGPTVASATTSVTGVSDAPTPTIEPPVEPEALADDPDGGAAAAMPLAELPSEPAPPAPGEPPPPAATDEEVGPDPHDEAKRFARLLVSEILLYNEQEVEAGRKNRDLLQRLREDLERSEQVYRQRVSADIVDQTDYFQDEVVRTLAGGDAGVLGAR